MKKGGGRGKGNAFERVIAKTIVEAFCDFGIKDKHCYRTPSSGGHRYAKHKDPGDLVIASRLRKMFPYSVECKSYGNIDMFSLWSAIDRHKKSSFFRKFLKQTCAAAKHSRLTPLLVFKKNRSKVLCAMPGSVSGVSKLVTSGKPNMTFQYKNQVWYIFRFDHVLRQIVKGLRRHGK